MSSPTTAPAPGFADRLRAQASGAATSSLVATALIQVLNVVTGVILARTLGPSGRGELAAVILWPTMLWTVGNLGVVDSVTFHSARRSAPQRSIVSTSLAIAFVQSAVLVAIGLVLVPLVLAKQEASVVRDCLIFLASVPTSLVTLYLGSLLNGTHRFVAFNVVRATVFVGNAAGLVALAIASELTVTSAVFAYLASQLVTVRSPRSWSCPRPAGRAVLRGCSPERFWPTAAEASSARSRTCSTSEWISWSSRSCSRLPVSGSTSSPGP